MNHTAKHTRVSGSSGRLIRTLPAALAMIGVGITAVSGELTGSVLVSSILAATGYLLAILSYYAIARCGRAGEWFLPLLVAVATVASGYLFGGLEFLQPMGLAVALVFLPAMLVGLLCRMQKAPGMWYQSGLLVVLILITILAIRKWLTISADVSESAPLIVEDMAARLASIGLHTEPSSTGAAEWVTRLRLLAWLIPGLLGTSILVQYSIGVLWFASRTTMLRKHPRMRFTQWRMPRYWALVLVASIIAHLAGGEIVRQIADSVLFGMGVYLAVFGLAALENVMLNWRWPLWVRIIVYVAIAVIHLYGLLLLSVIGMLRMLFEWHRPIVAEN